MLTHVQNMDRMWRKALEQAAKTRGVIQFCANPTLLNTFRDCNKLLEQVSKCQLEG